MNDSSLAKIDNFLSFFFCISADPNGSIEFMTECTTIDTPFCLYDSDYNKHNNNNFSGPGVLVCSVGRLANRSFSARKYQENLT